MKQSKTFINPLARLSRKKNRSNAVHDTIPALYQQTKPGVAGGAAPTINAFGVMDTSMPKPDKSTYLAVETKKMDRQRRELEQQGHRRLARVHAREHPDNEQAAAPEAGMQNDEIMQHPWLEAQRFDGIDPNLNPEPPLNSEARREFDNKRREQELEKQLRLNPELAPAPAPRFGYTTPTPKPS